MSKFSEKQVDELVKRVSELNDSFQEIQKTFPFVDKFTCHKLNSKYIIGFEITID